MAESTVFLRRNWQIQRAGWVLMSVVVLLGLAGVFGQGPASTREAVAPGLTLRYQRVARLLSTQSLEFVLDAPRAGDVALELDAEFVSRTEIERIIPEPREVSIAEGVQRLIFSAGGNGAVPVRLVYHPRKLGRLPARFGTPGAAPLPISILVLP